MSHNNRQNKSQNTSTRQRESQNFSTGMNYGRRSDRYRADEYEEIEQYEDGEEILEDGPRDDYVDDNNGDYFSPRNNIINERMIKYQKRKLPSLQRYNSNNSKDIYYESNNVGYWEDDEYAQRICRKKTALFAMWQKFVVTFASILSLVCIAWIAYNWSSNRNSYNTYQNEPVIIEPEQQSFKVLPGNLEDDYSVPNKDKTIYERVNPGMSHNVNDDLKLLPPQAEPEYISNQKANHRDDYSSIEEYSIIDDKTYYIKLSSGKNKQILENESKLIKKKYAELLSGKHCLVKKVRNNQGEQKHAILIGPFDSQDDAADTARDLGGQCYIISVKE
jgi:hypothetical protein